MKKALEDIVINIVGGILAIVLVVASILFGFILKILVKLGILKFP